MMQALYSCSVKQPTPEIWLTVPTELTRHATFPSRMSKCAVDANHRDGHYFGISCRSCPQIWCFPCLHYNYAFSSSCRPSSDNPKVNWHTMWVSLCKLGVIITCQCSLADSLLPLTRVWVCGYGQLSAFGGNHSGHSVCYLGFRRGLFASRGLLHELLTASM
jgi:hypothetical protein